MINLGIPILYLWEDEIKRNTELVKQKITEYKDIHLS